MSPNLLVLIAVSRSPRARPSACQIQFATPVRTNRIAMEIDLEDGPNRNRGYVQDGRGGCGGWSVDTGEVEDDEMYRSGSRGFRT